MTSVIVVVCFLLTLGDALYVRSPSEDRDDPRIRWAAGSIEFIRNLRCEEVTYMSHRSCQDLTRVPRSDMNLYLAEDGGQRLKLVNVDEPLNRDGQAVVVVDPYPKASFGHLILVFLVESGLTRLQCQLEGGRYMGNKECLLPMVKTQCQNLLLERGLVKRRRRNVARKCEINFIPIVHRVDQAQQPIQMLRCVDNIAGFASCRRLRTLNETRELMCDPLNVNHHRCSVTHDTVRTHCRLLEICDQAILLSGGWNRDHSLPLYKNNLKAMYDMLRHNGFHKDNIKTFFANGGHALDVLGEENRFVYPSAFKLAIRNHLRRLCQAPKCVDSLVLYLNSPTLPDGSTLLWDINANGELDATEMYSVRELAYDLEDCTAQRVFILADQSYSEELVRAFQRSWRHPNVRVFASGGEQENSWSGEFTSHWASFRHTHTCVGQVHQASQMAIRMSTPTCTILADPSQDRTIFGAPCDVQPPYSAQELQQQFYGCQNLPSSLWIDAS